MTATIGLPAEPVEGEDDDASPADEGEDDTVANTIGLMAPRDSGRDDVDIGEVVPELPELHGYGGGGGGSSAKSSPISIAIAAGRAGGADEGGGGGVEARRDIERRPKGNRETEGERGRGYTNKHTPEGYAQVSILRSALRWTARLCERRGNHAGDAGALDPQRSARSHSCAEGARVARCIPSRPLSSQGFAGVGRAADLVRPCWSRLRRQSTRERASGPTLRIDVECRTHRRSASANRLGGDTAVDRPRLPTAAEGRRSR